MKNAAVPQHISKSRAWVSIEQNGPSFVLMVHSEDGQDGAPVLLTRDELRELGAEVIDRANNMAPNAPQEPDQQTYRLKALEMARSTPGLTGADEVLKAAERYYAYIAGDAVGRLVQGRDYT